MNEIIDLLNCRVLIKSNNKDLFFVLKGQVTEDFDQEKILIPDGFERYIVDVKLVDMLNSCGIREWISFVKRFEEKKIVYINVPRVFITQMNTVAGFLTTNSTVHNFYAPYYCEEEDKEYQILVKSSDIKGLSAPVGHSPEGKELEFDAVESQYFRFLKRS